MWEKCREKYYLNKTSNFFVLNILFDLFSTQSDHQLKFLVHQNKEKRKQNGHYFAKMTRHEN